KLAVKAVQRLADQRHITLNVLLPQEPLYLTTNKAIAQQILINLLSQTIQHSDDKIIQIELNAHDDNAELHINCAANVVQENLISTVITHLLQQVRWSSEFSETGLRLHLNNHGTHILIIDDNEGLVDLLHLYISSNVCQVSTA